MAHGKAAGIVSDAGRLSFQGTAGLARPRPAAA
jgi:hypothetical protein